MARIGTPMRPRPRRPYPPPAATGTGLSAPEPNEDDAPLAATDTATDTVVAALQTLLGVAFRVLLWWGTCRLLMRSPLGAAVAAGAVIADVATLVPIALWMARRRRLSALEALLVLGAALWLQRSGHLALPDGGEQRGVAMLAFLAVLTAKVAYWARVAFHDEDDPG